MITVLALIFLTLIILNVVHWLIFESSQLCFNNVAKGQNILLVVQLSYIFDDLSYRYSTVFWWVLFFGLFWGFFLFVFFSVTCCTCEMPYFYRCLYCFGRCYGFHTLFFPQFIVTQTVVFRLSVLSISMLSVVYICSNFLCWLVSLLLKIHRLSIHTQQL